MERTDPRARGLPQCVRQARRARHADVRLHPSHRRIAAELGGIGGGLAALYRDLHRRLRSRAGDVREQLPGRQGQLRLRRSVERLQAHRRRLFRRRKVRTLRRHRDEILPAGIRERSSNNAAEHSAIVATHARATELAMDVTAWLRSLGLEQYEAAFRDNAIDPDLLPKLTGDDLKELGVGLVGHRRKLLDAIAVLRGPAREPLDQPAHGPTASASPVDAIGERRQVTVLFADLSGSTAFGQQLDAEEVHALLQQFYDRTDRIIQEHGGHIDRHIGDCVMAVFGAPVAHDNDAERAARAALAIQAAIPEVSARVGRPIGVHIGVAGGQVVASRTGSARYSEYTVTGNAANLASRLTSAAASGEILVSDETYGALAERFDCAAAGTLTIKGFAEPVQAWRLCGLRRGGGGGGRVVGGGRGRGRRLVAR